MKRIFGASLAMAVAALLAAASISPSDAAPRRRAPLTNA
jgi:hypothetical protein